MRFGTITSLLVLPAILLASCREPDGGDPGEPRPRPVQGWLAPNEGAAAGHQRLALRMRQGEPPAASVS